MHSKLAVAVLDREEQVRHLALAAAGPDAEVASALDEAARLARARGAPVAAAELYEEARALTPPADRAGARRRAVDAARCWFESGDSRRARSLLEATIAHLPAGAERGRALLVLAPLRSYDDDIRAAVALYEQALAEAGGDGEVLGAAHEGIAGNLFRLRERFAEAVEHARAAAALGEELGDGSSSLRRSGRSSSPRPRSGDRRHGGPRGRRRWRTTPTPRLLQGAGFSLAVARMWWEELDVAHDAFERMLERAAEIGDESSVPYLHVLLAQADCLRARYAEAAGHADDRRRIVPSRPASGRSSRTRSPCAALAAAVSRRRRRGATRDGSSARARTQHERPPG